MPSALGRTVHTLASAVADDGTVAIAYPTGTNQAALDGSYGGSAALDDGAFGTFKQDDGVEFTFGASTITVTNKSGYTWPAGSVLVASFGGKDIQGSYNLTNPRATQDAVADHGDRITDLENA